MSATELNDLRGYFVVQYQMSGIHAGIQALHAGVEMMEHDDSLSPDQHDMLHNWSILNKTAIILNGGYQSNLISLCDLLEEKAEKAGYPWRSFNESIDATNGLLTCVAVVIPTADIEAWETYRRDVELNESHLSPVRAAQYAIIERIKPLRLQT